MINQKSLDNLKPAKPGEVRNPNGRGNVKAWATVMKELFEEGEWSQKELVEAYIKQAKEGNIKAMEWLADRMDGKAKESIGLTIKDEVMNEKLKETFLESTTGSSSQG